MKFREYPEVQSIAEDDILLLDRNGSGTRRIKASKIVGTGILDEIVTPHMRKVLYRGQSLGTSVTSDQIQAIRSNTFKGLFLGDFWTINEMVWRIADFNYWRNIGTTSLKSPHVVIVPDGTIGIDVNWDYREAIHSIGYAGSYINNYVSTSVKWFVEEAFPSLLVKHNEYQISKLNRYLEAYGTSEDNTIALQNMETDLMNEYMVFGSSTATPASLTSYNTEKAQKTPIKADYSTRQLALFMINPDLININKTWWLKDIQLTPSQEPSRAVAISNTGQAVGLNVTSTAAVRPVFAIG